jgi:hypothetical protein
VFLPLPPSALAFLGLLAAALVLDTSPSVLSPPLTRLLTKRIAKIEDDEDENEDENTGRS